jgi:hypothetical protein
MSDSGVIAQLTTFGGGTSAIASFGIRVSPVNNYVSLAWRNNSNVNVGTANGVGDLNTTRGISLGLTEAQGPPTNTRLLVRGYGNGTNQMVIFEDSGGTDNVRFLDNGNIDFLRLPTSDPLVAGRLWIDSSRFLKVSNG